MRILLKIKGRSLFEKITKEIALLNSAFPKRHVEGHRIDWQLISLDDDITAADLANQAGDISIVLIDVKNEENIEHLRDLEQKKFLFMSTVPNFPNGIAPIILVFNKNVLTPQLLELPEIICDWVIAPVVMPDLVLRIFTSLRRKQIKPTEIRSGVLTLLPESRQLSYCGNTINLTPSELSAAELFLRQFGCVILIEDIALMFKLSGRSTDGSNIRVTMFQLRFKIEALTHCEFTLRSVYNEGYSLKHMRKHDPEPPFKNYEVRQNVATYHF